VIDAYERAERCSAKVICICKMRSYGQRVRFGVGERVATCLGCCCELIISIFHAVFETKSQLKWGGSRGQGLTSVVAVNKVTSQTGSKACHFYCVLVMKLTWEKIFFCLKNLILEQWSIVIYLILFGDC